MPQSPIVVLGAGPAGLAAAHELGRRGQPCVVVEQAPGVGGLARTVSYKGYGFDIGGHRFFTKVPRVEALWHEVLGDDFLRRPRLSRIFYQGSFFDYPLNARNALKTLGPVEASRCVASYLRARARSDRGDHTFEQWVSGRFGRRLFDIFFRTYTEKVWGIPCSEISADWASQRIKSLSLGSAIRNAVGHRPSTNITSLIEEFNYPRRGPGMMYDAMAGQVTDMGGDLRLRHRAIEVHHHEGRVTHVKVANEGSTLDLAGSHLLSSIPLTGLVQAMRPEPPAEVLAAAKALTYRHLIAVNLIVDQADLFPDNWVYVHSPELSVARIQNYGNWSPEMVPEANRSGLGLEYFCAPGGTLWEQSDEDLVALATHELEQTGLAKGAKVVDSLVVRAPRAYPIYNMGYQRHVDCLVRYLQQFENLQPMGRYGMFKYNNSDHSILTALLAVDNIIDGTQHDLWAINADESYHEEQEGV